MTQMSEVIVHLVDLRDESVRVLVTAASVHQLRAKAADVCRIPDGGVGPTLCVFVEADGAPRGVTRKVKLESEADFLQVRALPDAGRTVYFYTVRPGEPSPQARTTPEESQKAASKRSTSSQRSEFAFAVRLRYEQDNLLPITCLLCARQEGTKRFDTSHLIPFDSPLEDFYEYGIGGPTDGRNGVPMCPECHSTFDRGLWGFDEVKELTADTLQLHVFVTEGCRKFGGLWAAAHDTTINVPKDKRWPSAKVWAASWTYNFDRQQKKRRNDPVKRCVTCGVKCKTEDSYSRHKCNPKVGHPAIVPSPLRHWPPRTAPAAAVAAAAPGPPILMEPLTPGDEP